MWFSAAKDNELLFQAERVQALHLHPFLANHISGLSLLSFIVGNRQFKRCYSVLGLGHLLNVMKSGCALLNVYVENTYPPMLPSF